MNPRHNWKDLKIEAEVLLKHRMEEALSDIHSLEDMLAMKERDVEELTAEVCDLEAALKPCREDLREEGGGVRFWRRQ